MSREAPYVMIRRCHAGASARVITLDTRAAVIITMSAELCCAHVYVGAAQRGRDVVDAAGDRGKIMEL